MTKTRKRYRKKNKLHTRRERCAPRTKHEDKLSFTCYSPDALHTIKKLWNARHPDNIITSNDSEIIWNTLKKNMNNTCERESCWLRQHFIRTGLEPELLNYTFAPTTPLEWKDNPNTWLSSLDLTAVMKQFEYAYPCFEFLGPSPIDYDTPKSREQCVWDELCKFHLREQLEKGKNKIGIIFNLDEHYKPGSHWVAVFIDCKRGMIYYFDSYGDIVPTQILKFVRIVQEQSSKFSKRYDFHMTKTRHQYENSECGMYCLYFIINMLKGKPITFFENNKIPDREMEKLRKKLFN